MYKFTFAVDVVADSIDSETVRSALENCASANTDADTHISVKAGAVKKFSEQGYKVWRARVTGVTAEKAGDAHNSKVEDTDAVSAE